MPSGGGVHRHAGRVVHGISERGRGAAMRNAAPIRIAVIDVGRDASHAASLERLIEANGNKKETGSTVGSRAARLGSAKGWTSRGQGEMAVPTKCSSKTTHLFPFHASRDATTGRGDTGCSTDRGSIQTLVAP